MTLILRCGCRFVPGRTTLCAVAWEIAGGAAELDDENPLLGSALRPFVFDALARHHIENGLDAREMTRKAEWRGRELVSFEGCRPVSARGRREERP